MCVFFCFFLGGDLSFGQCGHFLGGGRGAVFSWCFLFGGGGGVGFLLGILGGGMAGLCVHIGHTNSSPKGVWGH